MYATIVVNTTTAVLTMKVGVQETRNRDQYHEGGVMGRGIHRFDGSEGTSCNCTYQEYVIDSAADRPRGSDDECVEICRRIAVDLDGQCSRLENMGAQLDRLSTYMQHRSASKFQFSTMLIAILFVLFYAVITLRA